MIICVTGKMASGKNFISSLLEHEGFVSIDEDKTVHQAIEKITPEIIRVFKPEAEKENINLENSDGSLNRRALGKLVFPHPELLKKQEDLVYPVVISMTKDFIQQNKDKNVIINATVAYKTPEILNMCSKILYIHAPLQARLSRSIRRDKMPVLQILQRFYTQRNLLKEYKKTGIPLIKLKNAGSVIKVNRKLTEIIKSL